MVYRLAENRSKMFNTANQTIIERFLFKKKGAYYES